MATTVPRPAAAWQEPFDAIPRSVQQRDDLTSGAKRLYGALSTAHRTRWQPTYADLARHLAASARSIVRWVRQLSAAGLIAVRRRGQGLPNLFTVVGLVTSGNAERPRTAVTGWQPPARARQPEPNKKRPEEQIPAPLSAGRCFGCGGDHGTPRCPRYGRYFNR